MKERRGEVKERRGEGEGGLINDSWLIRTLFRSPSPQSPPIKGGEKEGAPINVREIGKDPISREEEIGNDFPPKERNKMLLEKAPRESEF